VDIANHIEVHDLYVHPTFFYEFVWCMVGFGLLYLILKKFRKFSGQIFLCYGIWYGLERTVVEGLRTDSLYIGNTDLRVSQVLSIAIVVVCVVILVVKLLTLRKKPVLIEGIDYFPADEKQVKKSKKNKSLTEEKENEDFANESKKDEE
jgi:phosphatidylglycerol:prolipoprotein diacylglycerol transferase